MEYINYAFLLILWIGIVLLLLPKKYELRERALYYYGESKKKLEKSIAFRLWTRFKSSRMHARIESELAESLAYIKNIAILGRDKSVSTEVLLEELSEFTNILKPTFISMASHMHLNEKDLAAEELYLAVGDSYGQDIGTFLSGWEDMDSAEMLDSIEAYQVVLREKRETRQRQSDEMMSDFIYFPVVVNCLVVLVNFVYIGFFIEQQEMLNILFT